MIDASGTQRHNKDLTFPEGDITLLPPQEDAVNCLGTCTPKAASDRPLPKGIAATCTTRSVMLSRVASCLEIRHVEEEKSAARQQRGVGSWEDANVVKQFFTN
jgi:hypothetical protein